MQRGRLLLVAAAVIGAVSLGLPYFGADSLGQVSGIGPLALVACVALAGAASAALAGDRADSLDGLVALAVATPVALAVLATGALLIDAALAARQADAIGANGGIGSGLWTLAIASLTAVVGVVAGLSRRLG